MDLAAELTWGFLVGFVGWGICFQLAEPIATRLLNTRVNYIGTGLVRLIVVVFLIFAIMAVLALVPLFLLVMDFDSRADPQLWRFSFGRTFVASLVGVFCLGAINRLFASRRK
jgi:hypothetical protein